MAEIISRLVAATALWLFLTGCSTLPDVKRIEGDMSAMSYSTGVMASSMASVTETMRQMADRMERLEKGGNWVSGNLAKDVKSGERAIQNYLQAFLENDRATAKNVRGIREVLRNVDTGLRQRSLGRKQADRLHSEKSVDERISDLEERLKILKKEADKLRQESR